MAKIEHFTAEEIPYEILAKFGLTHEMIDDLPQNVMLRLLSSRTTPVLPIITENAAGQLIQSFARISLVRLADDTIDVCFAPKWVDAIELASSVVVYSLLTPRECILFS